MAKFAKIVHKKKTDLLNLGYRLKTIGDRPLFNAHAGRGLQPCSAWTATWNVCVLV